MHICIGMVFKYALSFIIKGTISRYLKSFYDDLYFNHMDDRRTEKLKQMKTERKLTNVCQQLIISISYAPIWLATIENPRRTLLDDALYLYYEDYSR